MAKKNRKSAEQVKEERATRAQERSETAHEANQPAVEARDIRDAAITEQQEAEFEEQVKRAEESNKATASDKKKATVLSKPGSAAGLKPGDLIAPSSNPGAAARIPDQPLQPESLQSHGFGILYDKDLDNPPYNEGDPAETDRSPSGSGSPSNLGHARHVNKDAEVKKAESLSSAGRMLDPDNPSFTGAGTKDATASPRPIGTHRAGKNNRAGGSNSGS